MLQVTFKEDEETPCIDCQALLWEEALQLWNRCTTSKITMSLLKGGLQICQKIKRIIRQASWCWDSWPQMAIIFPLILVSTGKKFIIDAYINLLVTNMLPWLSESIMLVITCFGKVVHQPMPLKWFKNGCHQSQGFLGKNSLAPQQPVLDLFGLFCGGRLGGQWMLNLPQQFRWPQVIHHWGLEVHCKGPLDQLLWPWLKKVLKWRVVTSRNRYYIL